MTIAMTVYGSVTGPRRKRESGITTQYINHRPQRISDAREPWVMEQRDDSSTGGIKDGGCREGDQEMKREAKRGGSPAAAERGRPSKPLAMPWSNRRGETPLGAQVMKAAVMSIAPQRTPAARMAGRHEGAHRGCGTPHSGHLALDRLHVEHLVGGAEAVALIESAASVGRMQCDDVDAAAAGLRQGKLDQMARNVLSAVLGLDVDIQQIAAMLRGGIERMGRPIEHHQSAAADHLARIIEREPAHVIAGLQLLRHPGLKVLRHHVEDAIVDAARVHKHAPAMVGDDGGVGGSSGAGSGHACEYRAEDAEPVHWAKAQIPWRGDIRSVQPLR